MPKNAFVAGFVGTSNWLRGTALATTEDRCRVRLGGGTVIIGVNPGTAAVEGTAVQVSVRPEAFRIQPGGAATGAGPNRIGGTVVSTGFQGSLSRLQVDTPAGTMVAHADPHRTYSFGERVELTFEEADAMLLSET